MNVVIILPTYNEKGNIERVITILEEDIFPKIKTHAMSILVADDMSPDGTAEEVRKLMKKWENIDISQGPKHGLGAAYVRGMTYAIEKMNADVMFEMDADLQHDPNKVTQFLEKIDEGYDMVIGTRYSDGGSIPQKWGLHRKAFSIFGNLLVRIVLMRFSIHDWTGGFRAIRKEVFLKEKPELTAFRGYTFQVSFLHKAVRDGFKIAEVPFSFNERYIGNSKIAPREYIVDLLKYIFMERIQELKRFIKFLFVGGTGFIVQILSQEVSIQFGFASLLALGINNLLSFISFQRDMIGLTHGVGVAIGAESAILSNFLFNNFWTFQDTLFLKERSSFLRRLVKFNLASFGSIFLQVLSVWVAENIWGHNLYVFGYIIPTRIAVIIPTIIFLVIPLNYLIYNVIIWKTQYLKHGKNTKT